MANPTINEQLALVLNTTATQHSRHLIDLWHPNLETQANVSSKGGKPVEGRTGVYADKYGNEWWPIRTWNDDAWRDRPLNFPLPKHVVAIGTTFWNGKDNCRFVSGVEMTYPDFYAAFAEYLGPAEAQNWNTKRIGILWPDNQYGRVRRGGKIYIQNLAFLDHHTSA